MCDASNEKRPSNETTVDRTEATVGIDDPPKKEETKSAYVDKDVQRSSYVDKDVLEDEGVYRALQKIPFFHGFLPREDLGVILSNEGDYLIRVSEVVTKKKEEGTTPNIKREIVLSACDSPNGFGTESEHKDAKSEAKEAERKVRNMVIRRYGDQFGLCVKSTAASQQSVKQFPTIEAMMAHYHVSNTSEPDRFLKTPMGLQWWEIQHTAVKLGEKLGEGAFGEVKKGILQRKGKQCPVAVKLMKGCVAMNKEMIKEMMREARLMRRFKHKNVVRFYGVAVLEQPLYILLELVDGGALNHYLQKYHVNVFEQIGMCLGAAEGLQYLHSNNTIHRDIAARNCLYSKDKVIKLSDFGLSRQKSEYKLHTSQKMPIKWLAPETIRTLYFSSKTDVYSYGVMCWEIFTEGEEPWENCRNTEVKINVAKGVHLMLPETCPEKFRLFVHEKIFQVDPKQRVSMDDVVRFIEPIITEMRDAAAPIIKTAASSADRSERAVRGPADNLRSVMLPPIPTMNGSKTRNASNSSRKSKSKVSRKKAVKVTRGKRPSHHSVDK